MTLYKCHHIQDTVILDDNIISYLAYLDWAESVGIYGNQGDSQALASNEASGKGTKELCWDCWNEKNCKIEGGNK